MSVFFQSEYNGAINLDMVAAVRVQKDYGRVKVYLPFTTPGCPLEFHFDCDGREYSGGEAQELLNALRARHDFVGGKLETY